MARRSGMGWLAAVLAVVGLGAGCSEPAPPSGAESPPSAAAPVALEVSGDREGLVFRYLDRATGQVMTAVTVAEIPEAARRLVVVFDVAAPPPAGWDLVADLSRGLPTMAEPREGFSFPVAVRAAAPEPRAGAREVVMFATTWCGYCKRARAFFKQHRIPYTEHDVESDPRAQGRLAALGQRAGVPEGQLQGVPIVFVDGQVMVGWDEARIKRMLGM